MKKKAYKELLRLRYMEEKVFFDMIKYNKDLDGISISDIIHILNIPPKRAIYILEKWEGKGNYNCGVSIVAGWLEVEEYTNKRRKTDDSGCKR